MVGGTVFDGLSDEPALANVYVVEGTIEAVLDPRDPVPAADLVLDAAGQTVLPGLIDAHCHAYGFSLDLLEMESVPLSYVALMGARRLTAALRRGFTTVRDPAGGDAGLSRAIDEALIPAPRYLWTGPALSQTGGHGDARAVDMDVCGCNSHISEIVDGVDALRVAVRDRFRRGAHAIKIMASGGVTSLTDPIRVPQYSPEEIRAVADEAMRRGSYVAAHAYSPAAIQHAVRNGVTSIEHGNLLNVEAADAMAAADAILVPTLAAYDAMDRRGDEVGMGLVSQRKNQEVLSAGRRAVEIALASGVRVGFGTDLMGSLEGEQLEGLRLQIEVAGVVATLKSATSVNADLIRRPDLGRIRPGCVADLLLVDADPFADPSVLWREPERPRTVMLGGVLG